MAVPAPSTPMRISRCRAERPPGSRSSWTRDRKSTRLNSSHVAISYAVFCLSHVLPPSSLVPYSTLFRSLMLHGRGGFYQDWTNEGGVVEQTEQHDVIVVMPDGGAGSFYSNANFPLPGREAAWESFIMDQVLPFVHANFRTDRSRMAIAGLSMGGWGALALGQRYYGHFRSISSYSGPADCNPATLDGAAVAGAIWACPGFDAVKYWPTSNLPGATWGADLYPEIAKGYNPIDNVGTYRDKRVFLRTGDGPW